jgi:hypothetical protein
MWNVEFQDWYSTLGDNEQDAIDRSVYLLEVNGPSLSRPHADSIKDSKHSNMKELRTQCAGEPLRTFFAFDPRRTAILLVAGNKAGDGRFYERMVPIADALYDTYLSELKKEGLI